MKGLQVCILRSFLWSYPSVNCINLWLILLFWVFVVYNFWPEINGIPTWNKWTHSYSVSVCVYVKVGNEKLETFSLYLLWNPWPILIDRTITEREREREREREGEFENGNLSGSGLCKRKLGEGQNGEFWCGKQSGPKWIYFGPTWAQPRPWSSLLLPLLFFFVFLMGRIGRVKQ